VSPQILGKAVQLSLCSMPSSHNGHLDLALRDLATLVPKTRSKLSFERFAEKIVRNLLGSCGPVSLIGDWYEGKYCKRMPHDGDVWSFLSLFCAYVALS